MNIPEASMRAFYAIMRSIFAYKVGPLALKTKEYAAALMRTRSMLREAQELMDIVVQPMGYYRFTIEDNGQWLQMLRSNGEEIRLARDELKIDDAILRKHDGCLASFVKYLGTWHLNGIMIPVKDIASRWNDLVKKDPDCTEKGNTDITGALLPGQSGGKEILYFKDLNEMKKYMVQDMHFQPEDTEFFKKDLPTKHPLMFISRNDLKFTAQISFGFSPYIADPANPYYDAAMAREAIKIFRHPSSISTEVILYLLEHNYIPDIYKDPLFCESSSAEEKQADARFLLRYIRKEDY